MVTGSVIPEGIWTHVVWVFEFNAMTVYVDGVQHVRNEDLRLGPLEGDPKLWLGAEQGRQRAVEGYYGALDDVRIYRQALSANVIKLLAK